MSSLIKRLLRAIFRYHSNSWSAWTRLFSAPLVFVPIWNRSWRQGAILGVWLIANPVVFPEPKDDKAWATRAMLGEEMWIAKRPLDRAMALGVGASAFGLGGVWGAYKRLTLRGAQARHFGLDGVGVVQREAGWSPSPKKVPGVRAR